MPRIPSTSESFRAFFLTITPQTYLADLIQAPEVVFFLPRYEHLLSSWSFLRVQFITTPENVRGYFLSRHDHRWSHPSASPLRSKFASIPGSWNKPFRPILAPKNNRRLARELDVNYLSSLYSGLLAVYTDKNPERKPNKSAEETIRRATADLAHGNGHPTLTANGTKILAGAAIWSPVIQRHLLA